MTERSRNSKLSRNDDTSPFNKVDAENMKRICLMFDRIDGVLRKLNPKNADLRWLSELLKKAKTGIYFVNIGYNGGIVLSGDKKNVVAFRGVDWTTLTADIRDAYALGSVDEQNPLGTVVPNMFYYTLVIFLNIRKPNFCLKK
jgi:hypothetical protein